MDLAIAIDSDGSEHPRFGIQGLKNCFAIPGSKDGKRLPEVRFSPGFTTAKDTGDTVCRGAIALLDTAATVSDVAYFAFHGGVYKLTWDGTAYTSTSIGALPGRGLVSMARNAAGPVQVGIVAGGDLFIVESDTLTRAPSGGLPDWNSIASAANQIVLGVDDGRMFATKLLDMSSISALDFATAESSPDGLLAVVGLDDDIYAFGRSTVEAWQPNGAAVGFPFAKLVATQWGCLSKHSVRKADGTLFWITDKGFVARMVSYQAKRVSNDAVERAIAGVSDPEAIEAYSYHQNGREFYGISHETFTWEMNIATGFWHERETQGLSRWQARGVINAFGKVLCGTTQDGIIHEIGPDSRVEGSEPVIAEWRSEPIAVMQSTPQRRMMVQAVTGNAAATGTTPSTDPVTMLDWTDTGAPPWSNERHLGLGTIGAHPALLTHGLGMIRRGMARTYRLRVSDPNITAFNRVSVE